MKKSTNDIGPVAIGGIGGSGTRVVAEILSELGFYMGNDLNESRDNLLYTLLFKRPKWYLKKRNNHKLIEIGLRLFRKLMTNTGRPSASELLFLLRAIICMSCFGHNKRGSGKGLWSARRIHRLFHTERYDKTLHCGWGWKEPNSLLLIENLADFFPDFKYIHIIRHGLDVAFNKNQQQLYNWASLYDIKKPKCQKDIPKASLKHWIVANKKVLELGGKLREGQFFVINFEELCNSPALVIKSLIAFLDVKPTEFVYERILHLPKLPISSGNYRSEDLNQFDEADLKLISKLGYSIM